MLRLTRAWAEGLASTPREDEDAINEGEEDAYFTQPSHEPEETLYRRNLDSPDSENLPRRSPPRVASSMVSAARGVRLNENEIHFKRLLSRFQVILMDIKEKNQPQQAQSDPARHEERRMDQLRWRGYLDELTRLADLLKTDESIEEDVLVSYESNLELVRVLFKESLGEADDAVAKTSKPSKTVEVVRETPERAEVAPPVSNAEAPTLKPRELIELPSTEPLYTNLSEQELRQRLGLSSVKKSLVGDGYPGGEEDDLAKAARRKAMDEGISEMVENLKTSALSLQDHLVSDLGRIQGVNDLVQTNLDQVQREAPKLERLARSWYSSCKTNLIIIVSVILVWIAMFVFMKLTPSPKRGG